MMDHDEILNRLYAQKRFDIGTEIRRDKVGAELRRASQLEQTRFLHRLIARFAGPSHRFTRPSPSQAQSDVTEQYSGESVATPS
jgi:hypothetical protein